MIRLHAVTDESGHAVVYIPYEQLNVLSVATHALQRVASETLRSICKAKSGI